MKYAITLKPGKELFDKIMLLKKEAFSKVGEQQYLMDEPHSTLYIGEFDNMVQLEPILEKKAKEFRQHAIKVKEWILFKNDPVTGKDAIACKVETDDMNRFKELQKKLAEELNKHRTGVINRFKNIPEGPGGAFKNNVEEYGYPFIGSIWIPHFSIGSFNHDAFDKIWPLLEKKCPEGIFEIESLNLYSLDEDNDNITLIKEYK